jgi:hypothetical protein
LAFSGHRSRSAADRDRPRSAVGGGAPPGVVGAQLVNEVQIGRRPQMTVQHYGHAADHDVAHAVIIERFQHPFDGARHGRILDDWPHEIQQPVDGIRASAYR